MSLLVSLGFSEIIISKGAGLNVEDENCVFFAKGKWCIKNVCVFKGGVPTSLSIEEAIEKLDHEVDKIIREEGLVEENRLFKTLRHKVSDRLAYQILYKIVPQIDKEFKNTGEWENYSFFIYDLHLDTDFPSLANNDKASLIILKQDDIEKPYIFVRQED